MSSVSNKSNKLYRGVLVFSNPNTGKMIIEYTSRVYEQPRFAKGKLTSMIKDKRYSWQRGFYYDPSSTPPRDNLGLVDRYIEETTLDWKRCD